MCFQPLFPLGVIVKQVEERSDLGLERAQGDMSARLRWDMEPTITLLAFLLLHFLVLLSFC